MTGLLLEGGGMRAGFVAGALMALMDCGLVGFHIAIAVSASVPTLAYFASRQRNEMEMVWRNELHSPNLVCYRNIPETFFFLRNKKPVLDIHYLVYEIFKNKYPLDIKNLLSSPTSCYFTITKVSEGQSVFLTPWDEDIYAIFEAALAVPGCYPKPTYLGEEEFMDGGISNPLPFHFLLEKNVNKILAILSTPVDYEYQPLNFIEKALLWRYLNRNQWILRRLNETGQIYRKEKSLLKQYSEKDLPSVLIVCPDKMPPARFITRDRKKINQTIDLGYKKAQDRMSKIHSFLSQGGDT